MINNYFLEIAQIAATKAGSPIKTEWLYAQFSHESAGFTSVMCCDYHNLGGLTQTTENDTPQPDGDYWYIQFNSFDDYADYFGRYLHYYRPDGLYNATNVEEYVVALKNGGYFGDSLENYLAGVNAVMAEEFPGVA